MDLQRGLLQALDTRPPVGARTERGGGLAFKRKLQSSTRAIEGSPIQRRIIIDARAELAYMWSWQSRRRRRIALSGKRRGSTQVI